jgi:hypothetical protein
MEEPFSRSDVRLPVSLNSAPQENKDYVVPFDEIPIEITTSEQPQEYKPFPFAMRPAPTGIDIYFGSLIAQINKFDTDDDEEQTSITNPEVHVPINFEDEEGSRYNYITLGWRGNVYLYWETNCKGAVEKCELVGPEEPESQSLPNQNGGKFFVKIGTVDDYDIPNLIQDIGSDVYWISAFDGKCDSSSSSSDSSESESESSSSDSSDSDSSDSSSSSSDSGSDKSTAIVPMGWHDKGYGALFTMESNEVLFEFVMRDVKVVGPKTVTRIDDRFLAVCEPDSMTITGVAGDRAGSVGAVVEKNNVILSAWPLSFLRPKKVTLKLTGVRKGFKHLDMPERSKEQFIANEKFINSAYPRK